MSRSSCAATIDLACAAAHRAAMLSAFDTTLAERFRTELPGLSLRPTTPADVEEPRGRWHGQEGFVVAPRTAEDVARVVRFANEARFGILPYGGGTGLVAGQVATDGPAPLILSLKNMAAIRAVYAEEMSIIAEAGCALEVVHHAAADAGLLFPLNYASKGTATIGAGLAVNSGGLNVLRYGMARELCLGVEAVLPDGSILHGLKRLRKDNTGYDLRHLLIGAEGTLGIITAAVLRLAPRPAHEATGCLTVESPAAAVSLLSMLRGIAGESISAFELISGVGLEFLTDTHPDTRQPFNAPPAWSVLIDLGTQADSDPQAALEALFAEAHDAGLVSDGVIASSGLQAAELWHVREMIPEANRAVGAIVSHDISLPLSELPNFIDAADKAIAAQEPAIRINCFGHLGDGNL
ncbi:MAG: FAD-binding oxidoreductase, partial [Pseudomonadota bacterium]